MDIAYPSQDNTLAIIRVTIEAWYDFLGSVVQFRRGYMKEIKLGFI